MEIFKNIEEKGPWSFIGVVLAILSIFYAVYFNNISNKNPKLEVEINVNENIISTDKFIKNVELVYKGQNLTTAEQSISYAEITFRNNSQVNILKNYYDEDNPLSIQLPNSTFLEYPKIISTSNDYLRKNLYTSPSSYKKINIGKVILEGQEYFTIGALILHEQNVIPEIIVSGKIAGQVDEIPVKLNLNKQEDIGIVQQIRNEKLIHHLIRFILYLFVFLSVILVSAVINKMYWNYIDNKPKRTKKNLIKLFLKSNKISDKEAAIAACECYIKSSLRHLRLIENFELAPNMLNDAVISYKKQIEEGNRKDVLYLSSGEPFFKKGKQLIDSCFRSDIISPIVNRGFLEQSSESEYFIKDVFYSELKKLINYIERK